jgi:hypothetical protein
MQLEALQMLPFTKYYYGIQIKDDVMNEISSTNEEHNMHTNFWIDSRWEKTCNKYS